MKKIDTPTAIIIGAIIIAISILIMSSRDPLTKCMERVIKEERLKTVVAASICSGAS
jgi:hypothetical protein